MEVKLLSYTVNADNLVYAAAKMCSDVRAADDLLNNISETDKEKLLKTLHNMSIGSPVEHATFTFVIKGVSRVFTHQLVRHRLAAYCQQSQRYTDLRKETGYVIPPTIKDSPLEGYFKDSVELSKHQYNYLVDHGIPYEDARFVLPEAFFTNIIMTVNARELRHIANVHGCQEGQWEIREVVERMVDLAREKAPLLMYRAGPTCVSFEKGAYCHRRKKNWSECPQYLHLKKKYGES